MTPSADAIGTLYLIPSSLGENDLTSVWPEGNRHVINNLDTFIVENLRTARRFLRKATYDRDFDEVRFFLINKHTRDEEMQSFLNPCLEGVSIGLLSEAGTPCIADPGQTIVADAHQKGIPVKPLTGPNSIMLALMASGMNGQQFSFHGYLPIGKSERSKKIKSLEKASQGSGITQIFMETPFRNNALFQDLIKNCQNSTRLCIAADLTMETEFIHTMSIQAWKGNKTPDLHKRPAIFLLSAAR